MKLTKTKKIILLGATIGVLIPSIVTPVVLTSKNSQNKDQKDQNKKDVLEVIKIIEEKSLSKRQIELSSDAKGKIIANNQEKIIKKIKELIGNDNLKKTKVEILMENDQEISPSFQEIKVKISKGNYSQEVKKEKTIFVKRSKTSSEIALIELNLIKDSLKALTTKVVNVYTSGAIDQKITTNKLEILKAVEKISGYLSINFKGAKIEVKNSEDLLPINSEDPTPIILILSKTKASIEVIGFKAKQMSLSQVANVDLNFVKTNLEALESKVVEIDTTSVVDHKIATNKVKILEEIKNLNGYSNIDFKGVSVEVKNSQTLLPASDQDPIAISLVLSKSGSSIEVSGFKAKSLSNQQILENTQVVNSIKSSLESLGTKIVDVYTSGAIDQKITNNKLEILKSIEKISGYSNIDFKNARIEVKNSQMLLPANDQSPIAITLVLSKPGVSIEVSGFSAKQMSVSQSASIDLNLVKKDLESLRVKTVEIDSSESIDQKITTNKVKILEEIKKLDGYSSIDFKNVNVEIKNSETLLPPNQQNPVLIILVLSKTNASNDVEVSGFSAKQQAYVIKNIKDKIIHKDILIAPNVPTSNQSEIQLAILEQLKIKNNTLNNEDLEKMTTNISSLDIGIKTEVELTITYKQKSKTINISVEKINLLKGSNISEGPNGVIFQDKFKNLWAMGNGTPLQVLRANQNGDGYVNTGWTNANDSGLTNGSNITDGNSGVIFQDKFKNLWAMGNGTPLQVLRANQNDDGYVNTGWNNANDSGLTNGSNITDGNSGVIFQDKFKNLWAMGNRTSLQVLEVNQNDDGYKTTGWTNANDSGLTNGSNITNGNSGVIFQDQFKNLWAMGNRTSLQVLEVNQNDDGYKTTGWTNANDSGLTNGSNITNGYTGTIFQDQFKNLWAMGNGTSLQVLEVNQNDDGYKTTGWTNANDSGLTNGSNITNGAYGTIFQDQFKNLWAMGEETNLQVLKVNRNDDGYVDTGWISNNDKTIGDSLLKGSNIVYGYEGIIFQDYFNNLWTSGTKKKYNRLKPQVLKVNSSKNGYVDTGWTSNNDKTNGNSLLKGLNINNATSLIIYQDQFKNLWAMSLETSLRVLKINLAENGYVDLWQT